jgi:periplasmic copper chaperone A
MKIILTLMFFLQSFNLYADQRLKIQDAWVREVIPGIKNSSAYFTIYNPSKKILKLVSASSPIAETVEIHSHTHENGVMKMRKLDFILIPPRGFLEFKMMSNHLMLFGIKKELSAGESVPFKLTFANKETVDFTAIVKRPK